MRRLSLFVLGICLASLVVACGDDSRVFGTDPIDNGPITLIAFDREGDLHIVAVSTGAMTQILNTFYDDGMANVDLGRVSGAIYNPVVNKIWMGLGGRTSPCESCILALDISTGEGVFVADGSLDGLDGFPGVAISSANRIFVHEGDSSGLYEVNNTTGEVLEVNSNTGDSSGNGMTFSNDGVFYLASNEKIYTIDQTTFDSTLVAGVSKSGFPTDEHGEIIALTTRPSDGVIFGIWHDGAGGGGGGPAYLITLAPTTGVMTYIGTMPDKPDGLAFVPTSSLPK